MPNYMVTVKSIDGKTRRVKVKASTPADAKIAVRKKLAGMESVSDVNG